jgi:UDP-glucose 4-epimerase
MNPRKVLVTGGAGFIGGHVADAYIARGERVWVVDDLSSGRRENVPADAEFVLADIGSSDVVDLFRDVGGFDVVNHHAAQMDVRRSVVDPRLDARINIDGLLNLLECARANGTRRFLFVSSGGVVYGEPEERPTPETAAKAPLSPYGVTKLSAEYYLLYYARIHGLQAVALRYSNVYGPRQDPHGEAGVVAIFSSRLHADEPLTIYGDGEQTRDYVFVGDVVRANMLFTDSILADPVGIDARAYNIGTGVETSVNQLADALDAASGRSGPRTHEAERPGELRHSCLDVGRARRAGWTPVTPLRDGLAETYRHIAAQEAVR